MIDLSAMCVFGTLCLSQPTYRITVPVDYDIEAELLLAAKGVRDSARRASQAKNRTQFERAWEEYLVEFLRCDHIRMWLELEKSICDHDE